MNYIKKTAILSLLLLQLSSNCWEAENFAENPNLYSGRLPDAPKSNKAKLIIGSLLTLGTLRAGYIQFKHYTLNEQVKNFSKISKSLVNGKVKTSDKPADIAKKWNMVGWRTSGKGLTYEPGISITDANYIYLNEPKVVACLYNDLKFRELFLVKNNARINFEFTKPEKTAYLQLLAPKAPIVVNDQVPTVETLKAVNSQINTEVEKLSKILDTIDSSVVKISGKPFSKSLVELAGVYRKTEIYKAEINAAIDGIDAQLLPEHKNLLTNRLQVCLDEEAQVNDLTDLYMFSHKQLNEDFMKDGILELESLEKQFINSAKIDLNAKDKAKDGEVKFAARVKGFVNDLYAKHIKSDYIDSASDYVSSAYGYLSLSLGIEQSNKFLKEAAKTYFKVAVSYVRLVQLQQVVSKVINLADGLESDVLTPAQLLAKEKAKVTKEISSVIKEFKKFEDIYVVAKKDITYMHIQKAFLSVEKSIKMLNSYDIVKIYGNVNFGNTLFSLLNKIKTDLQSMYKQYFGNNSAMRSNDDDDMGGIFGQMRPQNRSNDIYIAGTLAPQGVTNLISLGKGYLIGLAELEETSKL